MGGPLWSPVPGDSVAHSFPLMEVDPQKFSSHTNLRSEWYNKGNDEGREEDLFWERESHEPLLIFQWKKSIVA